jgi:TetR/AcrR family fatty acid metabolism transcriptional regulator
MSEWLTGQSVAGRPEMDDVDSAMTTVTSTDKRQRIVQAAEHLFGRRQYHEIKLEEVAHLADVGKGTLYLYFSDKDDLFFQTAVGGVEDMCEMLALLPAGTGGFRGEMLRAVTAISDFFDNRRPLFRMLLSEAERAAGQGGEKQQGWVALRLRLVRGTRESVAGIIRQGAATGQVRSDLPPEVLADYLLGMLRTRAREVEGVDENYRSHETLIDLFLNGIAGDLGRTTEVETDRQ